MSKSFIPVLFPKQRRGASLGEYGLVTGLIALAAIATIAPLGERISNTYQDVADAVGSDNVPPGVSDKPSEGTDSPSGPPLPPGDVEGNDTTTMHLSLGENAQSDLEDGYDHDWFRVTIPHSAHVHVNAKEAPVDGIHYLNIDFRNLDGSRIDDKNGAGAVDLIVNEVPAGDYFVDVSSYRSNDFGGYELQVNLVDDIPHGNGPSSQAHWIGSTSQSDILPGDVGDSFAFDVTQSGDYLFEASGTGSSPMTYLKLEIWNASGGRIADVNNQYKSKILLNDLAEGRYYARVLPYRNNAVGDYLFSSRKVEDIPGSASAAEPYLMGDVVDAEIYTTGDIDTLSFTITSVGDYSFSIVGSGGSPLTYMELEIRDASNALIAEKRGKDSASVAISNLAAGDYTARVFGYRSTSEGGYQFQGQ